MAIAYRFATAATLALLTATIAQAQIPATAAAPAPSCELHVWPTENYLGINTGLLSGFGPIGAVADLGAHKNRVQTVKDLMRDYLGPEIQMQELTKADVAAALRLDGYRIVVEEPTPFNEDVKKDPALKEKTKALNARIKSGQRLTASTAPCYAELVGTMIFYHKAMMYGSNLFGGWIFRRFPADPAGKALTSNVGAVKNPLENFPPKSADRVEPARAELRDAYAKDFAEYVQKKVIGAQP